jgi:hypothetical protein
MKTKIVNRYYCDHCRKGMYRKPAMERHEAICFSNRNRWCLKCAKAPENAITEARKKELIELARTQKPIEVTGQECPDCLLAYCIQSFPNDIEPGDVVLWYHKEQYSKDCGAWVVKNEAVNDGLK